MLVLVCNLQSGSGDRMTPLAGATGALDLSGTLTDAPVTVMRTGDRERSGVLRVTAPGYLDNAHTVGPTNRSPAAHLELAAVGATQAVLAAGSIVSAGPVTLAVTPASFATRTSTTWLELRK